MASIKVILGKKTKLACRPVITFIINNDIPKYGIEPWSLLSEFCIKQLMYVRVAN